MPNGLRNWKFEDVVAFLEAHGFEEVKVGHSKGSSHHYFKMKDENGVELLVHIQYHAGKSIPEGTLGAVIMSSGIVKKVWRNYSK